MISANSFGHKFIFHTFGESHGPAVGVVIDGLPAGIDYKEEILLKDLSRRKPGFSDVSKTTEIVSQRNEPDFPEILSGIFEGKTLGTPICVVVKNTQQKSSDYEEIKFNPRQGHADDMWKNKFLHSDHRGGGRSSARETVARVIAGSFAKMMFQQLSIKTNVVAFASQIGGFQLTEEEIFNAGNLEIDSYLCRYPSIQCNQVFESLKWAQVDGESFGGSVDVKISCPPKYLGQPVFHKFKSDLCSALMSIGATVGVIFPEAVKDIQLKGTEFHGENSEARYNGIRGGITTGEEIRIRIFFKPTSSILDVAKKGRHDPSVLIRAIPVVESMVWSVLADHYLWSKTDHI